MSVRLLEHDRNDEKESKLITRKIDRIVKHKNYSPSTFNNDIALIRMDKEVSLGKSPETPSPVCLPMEGWNNRSFLQVRYDSYVIILSF